MCCGFIVSVPAGREIRITDFIRPSDMPSGVWPIKVDRHIVRFDTQGGDHRVGLTAWMRAFKLSASVYLRLIERGEKAVLRESSGPCDTRRIATAGEAVEIRHACPHILARLGLLNRGE